MKMRVSWIFILLFFTASHVNAQSLPVTCSVPPVNKIDVDDIHRLVAPPCSLDLETLVTSLPEEMKDSAVFVSNSRSLFQECIDTPLNPRILYFTKNLVVAVPWKAHLDANCRKIEVIGKSEGNTTLNPTLIDFKNGNARIDASGHTCIACHTDRFLPIWENYPVWKNKGIKTYGYRDDNLVIGSDEYEYVKQFFKKAESEGKSRWFGNRVKNFLSRIPYLEKKSRQTHTTIDDYKAFSEFEKLMLPFVFIFNEFSGEDLRSVKNNSYSSPDGGARSNMRLGKILNEFNARTLAAAVVDKLGTLKVKEHLKNIDMCTSFFFLEESESRGVISQLRAMLVEAGFTGNELNISFGHLSVENEYSDGGQMGYEALIAELLVKLGASRDNFRTYSRGDSVGTPPGYASKYSVSSQPGPSSLFYSCEKANQVLRL